MAATASPKVQSVIEVPAPLIGEVEVGIVGLMPFICNRLSEKARHELLLPRGRPTEAEKKSTLKHDPVAEFRASPYLIADEKAPTRLAVPGAAFKKAMMTAALRLPDTTKTEIGQLAWVQGYNLSIYGLPRLFGAIVRQAGAQHTPDTRFRAILPAWACKVTVRFLKPNLTETTVVNLLSTAGFIVGVGDWRPEKGSGTFGQFRLCQVDDPELLGIVKNGARKAQVKAMDDAEPYDEETAELMDWYTTEVKRRGR